MQCADAGYSYADSQERKVTVALPAPDKEFSSHLLVTGSQAMGLRAMHAGVRLYAGYPMTPSSPLLSFIADHENETRMVVKQAEDEITAAHMVSGHDPSDLQQAKILAAQAQDRIACGILYQREDIPNFYERLIPRQGLETTCVAEVRKYDVSEYWKALV
jgi:Pyruvate flavodoxin/ferredoxin oxidoreductase, thiamine diP-bdg/Pyruvate ferredoxin oxidoreductase beta subunit C terminal